jgi:proline dehydrogenase
MGSREYTERTLPLVTDLHAQYVAVGTVIQAYLHRSEKDIEILRRRGIRVRLVKGAYLEPPAVAFRAKADVDRNFVRLMRTLLAKALILRLPRMTKNDRRGQSFVRAAR